MSTFDLTGITKSYCCLDVLQKRRVRLVWISRSFGGEYATPLAVLDSESVDIQGQKDIEMARGNGIMIPSTHRSNEKLVSHLLACLLKRAQLWRDKLRAEATVSPLVGATKSPHNCRSALVVTFSGSRAYLL